MKTNTKTQKEIKTKVIDLPLKDLLDICLVAQNVIDEIGTKEQQRRFRKAGKMIAKLYYRL